MVAAMVAAAEAAEAAEEAADAAKRGVAIWPVTVESKLICRVDRATAPPAKGDGDSRFRAAIVASHEKNLWDGRYAICMHGVGPSDESVYVEIPHPRRLRLQPPKFAANKLAVEAALRACEVSKKMRAGTLTQRYRIEELTYAVGYIPTSAEDGAPKKHFVVSVWMETKGHFDSVNRFFAKTQLRGEECAYRMTVHEDNLDHVQQFVHETTGDKCGCTWLLCTGITPFKRVGVVDADVAVMATTVAAHPTPAPPEPDLIHLFFDIECVKSSTPEECRKVMANPSTRDALPDPNIVGHEVRMIAADYVKGDVKETVVHEWQPDPAKRRPAPWTVRTRRGLEYQVVNSYGTEATMLMAFLDEIRERKCRVISGHNINQFDLPYIIARLALLLPSVPVRALVFGFDPSDRYERYYDFEQRRQIAVVDACKQRRTIALWGGGVVALDTIVEARSGRHGQLKRLGLAAVCEAILNSDTAKDPVHYTDIETGLNGIMTEERYLELCALTDTEPPAVFDPTVHPWQLIRTYCVKDALAVRDLVMMRIGPKVVGIAMNSAVPLQAVAYGKSKLLVTTRHGQQCARDGVLLNRRAPLRKPPANKDGKKFLGGLVHAVTGGLWSCVPDEAPAFGPQTELPEPLRWIYKYVPRELLRQCLAELGILQLDFESMYPNIIMEGNLSGDTQLEEYPPYPHEVCEAQVRELRGEPEAAPPFPPPPKVPHYFPTGLWADAPGADAYSTYVVNSAVKGIAPFVFRFVKKTTHHGALTKVVQQAFEDRKRRKKDKGRFKKVAAEIDAKPAPVADPSAVYDAAKRLIAETGGVTAETLAEATGLTLGEIKYVAKLLSKQADVDQAVLKIINNAMFGACGYSPKNPRPDRQPEPTENVAVAASITARGQQQNRVTEAHMRDVWDLVKVAGDTDSVLSAMKLAQFAEGCTTFDEVIAKAWAHSVEIAASVNRLINSPHAKIEPDGLTVGGYFHAMKNRATLDVVDPKLPMEKVVKGMKPARVNEPGVVREAAQAFIDVLFATTRSPITGFRMALVCNLWDFFERFLLPPGATNDCGQTGHAFDMYVRRTFIKSIKSKLKSMPGHIVVIKAKAEREKLPMSFYVGSFVEWVIVRGPKAKALRAVEASQANYKRLDLANSINDVFRYLATIVTKPWQTGDKSPILPAPVWSSMKATYTSELSAVNSKLISAFGGRRGHDTTPEDRLRLFLDILARPDGAAAAAAPRPRKRKASAPAPAPPSVTLNSFFRPVKKGK